MSNHGAQRADFVIADMVITEERSKILSFTQPFMRAKLAALTPKSSPILSAIVASSSSMSASSSPSNETASPSPVVVSASLLTVLQHSKRAVVKGSQVERYFRTTKDAHVYHLLPSAVAVRIDKWLIDRPYRPMSLNLKWWHRPDSRCLLFVRFHIN